MSEQSLTNEKAIELLLDIADRYIKGGHRKAQKEKNQNALATLLSVQPFNEYGLDDKEIKIIAILFGHLFEDVTEKPMNARTVLMRLEEDRKSSFLFIKRIERLRKLGILDVTPGILKNEGDEDDISGIGLIRSCISLSDEFLNRLDGGKEGVQKKIEPYKDNFEYLDDQFEKLELIKKDSLLRGLRHGRRPVKRPDIGIALPSFDKANNLQAIDEKTAKRLEVSGSTFPFEIFKKEKNLDQREELAVLALLEVAATGKGFYSTDELLDILTTTSLGRLSGRKILQNDGKLVKEKIVDIFERRTVLEEEECVKLSDDVKARLLEEKKHRTKRLEKDDFFEVVKPSVPLDNVILHHETSESITLAVEMVRGDALKLLREWEVKDVSLAEATDKRKHQPLTMLFYGPPGTGKTLAANAVALAMKREIITLDCSKLLSAWVGESEQNTRKIFDRYRDFAKGMKNPPVLFLNEADQFLHRRINAGRAADHMYNQMQNIFLEQMEKFEGLLIATTNMAENMDPAFSRRFHFKIEFRRPGQAERLQLWQLHLPPKAPLSGDVDLRCLSERYNFTGGQIAIVVRKAAGRAARRGDILRQDDFVTASEEEHAGNFDEKAKRGIGFGR